jgi:septum formation protein
MPLDLILASASTARAKLLRGMGLPFRVVVSGVDETDLPGETPDAKALRLARLKAEAVANRLRSGIVLGADSLVALLPAAGSGMNAPPRILGKPKDKADAMEMLRLQMGRVTEVITAICLIDASNGLRKEGVDRSQVILKAMSDKELDQYASSPKVLTSAGGYLLEDEDDPYVSLARGELGTVLGLPVSMTKRLLSEMGLEAALDANING